MNLQNINKRKAEKGFTIVELLIVIVVIGILAAIVIVAFNGVQNSAKTQSANSAASNVAKKIEAYNAAVGSYPTGATTAAGFAALLNAHTESKLGDLSVVETLNTTNGQKSVQVQYCSAPAAGAIRIAYFDYGTGNTVTDDKKKVIQISDTPCNTWGAVLGS